MGFWFLGQKEGAWAGLDGGVMPGEEVAAQWSPSVQRALGGVWMGPPEVGH